MQRHGMKISTWVNHGNPKNAQNIGDLPWFGGDDPASPAFHLDITKELGLRYFWQSQLTHLVGQNCVWTAKNRFKNTIQKAIAVKNRGRQIDPFFSNRLVEKVQARDGSELLTFMRFINPWGKHAFTDIHNLPNQIGEPVLRELVRNKGCMILYTHLGSNRRRDSWMPPAARGCLENLARFNRDGKIFIATTTRLLRYLEMIENIRFTVRETAGGTEIHLQIPNDVDADFQGLTLYCTEPGKTALFFQERSLEIQMNHPDNSGLPSISIPWRRLEFPEDLH